MKRPWEPLERRQLMSGTIEFLGTSGPVANVGDDPRGVVTADMNGDGKLDLLTANAQGFSAAINDGSGKFAVTADVNLGKQVLAINTADLNGDGKADLVLTEIFGDYATVQGNGDGTFGAPTELEFTNDITPSNISLADVNGDGRTDLVSGVAIGSAGVVVRYNASTTGGTIAFDAQQFIASSKITDDAIAADVNADGKPDLLGLGNDGVTVLLNTGNDPSTGRATFGAATTFATTFLSPDILFTADVTGDGKPDIVASYLSGDFDVLAGNGDGTFGAAGKQEQIVINEGFADVNGDGKLDAYGSKAVFGPKLAIALGNGDGTFQEPLTLTLGDVAFNGTAVGDVNGDGKPDVLVVDNDQDRVVILPGGGNATTPPVEEPAPGDEDPTPDPEPTPAVNLTTAAPTGLASQLVAGDKVKTSVNVTNGGSESSNGPVTIKLYASADGTIDDSDTVLTTFTKTLKIAAGKAKAVALRFLAPGGVEGSLQVLAQVSGGGDATPTTSTGVAVNFVTPKVDVSAGFGALPAVQAGKKASVAVDLTNTGGAAVKAGAKVTLFATTSGTLDGSEVQLTTTTVSLNLKAGKAKKLKLSFLVPAELAGQSRTLIARLELPGDISSANDLAVSTAVEIA